MYPYASTFGKNIDNVFIYILSISVVILVLVTATMIYFVVKYNRKKNPEVKNIDGNLRLEIIWTVIPTLLVLSMFYYGWYGFKYMRDVPKGALAIKVIGQMYFWTFEYEGGKKSDVLRVPARKPIRLQLSSKDMVHSFYLPAFRIKEDAVPGMKTHTWFFADKPDSFDIYCAEYCGLGHSKMITRLIVMSEDDFQKWLSTSEKMEITQDEDGRKILKAKGCLSCHSTDGSKVVGPSFKAFVGGRRTVKTKGKERIIIGDKAYLKKSLMEPEFDIVKGYPPVMPPYKGNITEKEIDTLFEYFKTLK